jgi:hypothetical protein
MTPNIDGATREGSRVALVTSHLFPDLWDDDHPVRDALRDRGVLVDAVRWDDPTADWDAYDLAVLRSPWDYPARRDEFVAWAYRVPRLANPADIVDWNTDKRYLSGLIEAGLPITPTEFVAPGAAWTLPDTGEWVIKPTISAGSKDTGRYACPEQAELAAAHLASLQAAGRTVMVQPYLAAVDAAGETAVLFTPDAGGTLAVSHAIRKAAMLTGPYAGDPDLAALESIEPREPTAAEVAVAERTLAAVPGGPERLLYARVDMIPGPDGSPLLVELELTEPSLFFLEAPGSAERFAAAIVARLGQPRD